MPLIQCLLGHTVQTVAGQNYSFDRDRFGRYVSVVHNADHAKVFLSVAHYQAVDDEAAPAQLEQAKAAEPRAEGAKKPRGRKKADPLAAPQTPVVAKPDGAADPAAGAVDPKAGAAADAGGIGAASTQDPAPTQDQAPAQLEQAKAAEQE